MSLLTTPLPSVDAYVEHFSRQPLPVLRHTANALERHRAAQDSVDARALAALVLGDPMLTMTLLTHLEKHRRRAQNHDITTIDRAIMMMGLGPFFDTFGSPPTLENQLAAHPHALAGALKVIGRARRAAHYAHDWAIVRHDLDVEEITVATLLREAAEIVCWAFAPTLTAQVYALQQRDRSLRSTDAQRAVFGITADELQHALIHAWKLPGLLIQLLDDTGSANPRVRTVALAARFTRHLARGWDDPALPDDLAALAALLPLKREQLLERVGAPVDAWPRLLPEPMR